MDEKHVADFRDDLGLTIERSMAVQPAPELGALVRARVERERTATSHWPRWQFAFAVVAVVVLAIVTHQLWQPSSQHPAPVQMVAAQPMRIAAVYKPTARASRPRIEPDLGRHADRASALNAYVAFAHRARIDQSATGTVRPSAEPLAMPAITIDPIAIESLPKLAVITGERQ